MKNLFLLITIIVGLLPSKAEAQCYLFGNQYSSNTTWFQNYSGDAVVDQKISENLPKLISFFGVKPEFYYMSMGQPNNAFYTPSCSYIPCHGKVFLGIGLINEHLRKENNYNGLLNTIAVLAHEYAHCFQTIHNLNFQVGLTWKYQELHADYLAGVFMATAYDLDNSAVEKLFENFYSIGDHNRFSPAHHGTPQERRCAFLEGYFFAKENPKQLWYASSYGVDYVYQNNPCSVRKYLEYKKASTELYSKDVKTGNLFSVNVNTPKKIKYTIQLVRNDGQIYTYYLNQKRVTSINQYGQYVSSNIENVNSVNIKSLGSSFQYTLQIFRKNWLFGLIPEGSIPVQQEKGKSMTISLKGSTISLQYQR
jgi:hypothetical protein